MPFDVFGARREGYSDQEITDFLSQQFDVHGAINEGYTLEEIGQAYGGSPAPEVPRETVPEAPSPIQATPVQPMEPLQTTEPVQPEAPVEGAVTAPSYEKPGLPEYKADVKFEPEPVALQREQEERLVQSTKERGGPQGDFVTFVPNVSLKDVSKELDKVMEESSVKEKITPSTPKILTPKEAQKLMAEGPEPVETIEKQEAEIRRKREAIERSQEAIRPWETKITNMQRNIEKRIRDIEADPQLQTKKNYLEVEQAIAGWNDIVERAGGTAKNISEKAHKLQLSMIGNEQVIKGQEQNIAEMVREEAPGFYSEIQNRLGQDGIKGHAADMMKAAQAGSIGTMLDFANLQDMLTGGKKQDEIKRIEKLYEKALVENPENAKTIVGKIFNDFVRMMPAMATGMAANAVAPGSGVAFWVGQGTGNQYGNMIKEGYSHRDAALVSVPVGILYGAIENLQVGQALNMGTKEIGQSFMRFVADKGIDLAKETFEEVAQQWVQDVGTALARPLAGQGMSVDEFKKAIGNGIEQGVQSVGPLGIMTAFGFAGGSAQQYSRRAEEKRIERANENRRAREVALEYRLDNATKGIREIDGKKYRDVEIGGKSYLVPYKESEANKPVQGISLNQPKEQAAPVTGEQEIAPQQTGTAAAQVSKPLNEPSESVKQQQPQEQVAPEAQPQAQPAGEQPEPELGAAPEPTAEEVETQPLEGVEEQKELQPLEEEPDLVGIAAANMAQRENISEEEARAEIESMPERARKTMIASVMEANEAKVQLQTDPLTGLLNRTGLMERGYLEKGEKPGQTGPHPQNVKVGIVDIDNFKFGVNEPYGHRAGDQVLNITGEILKTELAGIADVGRYGGEELTIYPLRNASEESILKGVEEARRKLAQIEFEGEDGQKFSGVTFTAGFGGNFEQSDALLRKAKEDNAKARTHTQGGTYAENGLQPTPSAQLRRRAEDTQTGAKNAGGTGNLQGQPQGQKAQRKEVAPQPEGKTDVYAERGTPATEASRAVADLQKEVRAAGYKGNAKAVEPKTKEYRSVVAFAKALGLDAILYEADSSDFVQGASNIEGHPNRIFVNTKAQRPAMSIALHESLHQLEQTNPAAYRKLLNTLNSSLKEGGMEEFKQTYLDRYFKPEERAAAEERLNNKDLSREMMSELIEQFGTEKGFWQDLAARAPESVREFIRAFSDIIQRLRRMLSGGRKAVLDREADLLDIKNLLKDVQAVRAAAIEAIRERAQGVESQKAKLDAEIAKITDANIDENSAAVRNKVNKIMKTETRFSRPQEKWEKAISTESPELADMLIPAIRAFQESKLAKKYELRTSGTPARYNVDYIVTIDFDSKCPKQINFKNYMDAVFREISSTESAYKGERKNYKSADAFEEKFLKAKRTDERWAIVFTLASAGVDAPCPYCYVEAKRIPKTEYAAPGGMTNVIKEYAAYSDQLVKYAERNPVVKVSILDILNMRAGIRMLSNTDMKPTHITDLMRVLAHMQTLQAFAHAYTKTLMLPQIAGKTGLKINMSVMPKIIDGKLVYDQAFGHDIKTVEKFLSGDISAMAMATSDAIIERVGEDDRVGLIIPFHASGIRKDFYQAMGYTDYSDVQKEVWSDKRKHAGAKKRMRKALDELARRKPGEGFEALNPLEKYWAAEMFFGKFPATDWKNYKDRLNKMVDSYVPPVGYRAFNGNSAEGYLEACNKYGVTPKFPKFQKRDWYFKLITDIAAWQEPQRVIDATKIDFGAANEVMERFNKLGGDKIYAKVNKSILKKAVRTIKEMRDGTSLAELVSGFSDELYTPPAVRFARPQVQADMMPLEKDVDRIPARQIPTFSRADWRGKPLAKQNIKDPFAKAYAANHVIDFAGKKIGTEEDLADLMAEQAKAIDVELAAKLDPRSVLDDQMKRLERRQDPEGQRAYQMAKANPEAAMQQLEDVILPERKRVLTAWYNYLTKENDEYAKNPFIQMIVWEGITKDIRHDNEKNAPELNPGALADVIGKIGETSQPINFLKAYNKAATEMEKKGGEQLSVDLNTKGKWIRIEGYPSLSSQANWKEKLDANIKRLQQLSASTWCTRSYMAPTYLKRGDFWLYILDSGSTEVAVRFEGDTAVEIEGTKNNREIPDEYLDEIQYLFKEKGWEKGGIAKQLSQALVKRKKMEKLRPSLESRDPRQRFSDPDVLGEIVDKPRSSSNPYRSTASYSRTKMLITLEGGHVSDGYLLFTGEFLNSPEGKKVDALIKKLVNEKGWGTEGRSTKLKDLDPDGEVTDLAFQYHVKLNMDNAEEVGHVNLGKFNKLSVFSAFGKHWFFDTKFIAYLQKNVPSLRLMVTDDNNRTRVKVFSGDKSVGIVMPLRVGIDDDGPVFKNLDEKPAAPMSPPAKGKARFARPQADTFFSPTLRAAENLKMERGTGDQMLAMITKTPGVKKAEVDWLGLEGFLKGKKRVTKAEVADFVRQNQVTIEEVQKGSVPKGRPRLADYNSRAEYDAAVRRADQQGISTNPETKFDQYTLPGGVNQRELMLTLPVKDSGWLGENENGEGKVFATKKEAEEFSGDADMVTEWAGPESYQVPSAHSYGEKAADVNRFAHIRVNDRVGPNSEKVLFVEEIQSDWAREARNMGVGTGVDQFKIDDLKLTKDTISDSWHMMIPQTGIEYSATPDAAPTVIVPPERLLTKMTIPEYEKWLKARFKEHQDGKETFGVPRKGVPNQPFLKNWQEVALKRILRMAAEEGYDRVAWISGEQTADRYALSKQVRDVAYRKIGDEYSISVSPIQRPFGQHTQIGTYSEKDLPGAVGKDLAKRILENEGSFEQFKERHGEYGWRVIKGEGLKIGGVWAENLYDKQVPTILNKIGKPFGAKVDRISIAGEAFKLGAKRLADFIDEMQEKYEFFGTTDMLREKMTPAERAKLDTETKIAGMDAIAENTGTQQSIPITDAMRESVVYEGQPMFARPQQIEGVTPAEREKNLAKFLEGSKVKGVVYHGTNQAFSVFDKSRTGENTKAVSSVEFFFSENPMESEEYADLAAKTQRTNAVEMEKYVQDMMKKIERAERAGNFDLSEELTREMEDREFSSLREGEIGQQIYPVYLNIKNPMELDLKSSFDGYKVLEAIKKAKKLGHDGLKLINVYDPVGVNKRDFDTTQWVAFSPSQIKSATGNRGTFDAGQSDIRFARADVQPADKNLIALHNLSAENILHAEELGGLAMPSLAVTKKNVPFEGYGEITMIANRDLVDPKNRRAKVFDADIYSPRYPQMQRDFSRAKFEKAYDPIAEELADNIRGDDSYSAKSLVEKVDKYKGQRWTYANTVMDQGSRDRDFEYDPVLMYAFAKEKGIDFKGTLKGLQDVVRSGDNRAEHHDYVMRFLNDTTERKKIFKGYTASGYRRYADYNLQNILREMKKELRGGEGFNYGAGSVRSKVAKKFTSVEQMKKAENKIVSKEDIKARKEDYQARLSEIASEIAETRKSKPGYSDQNPFMAMDNAVEGIMEGIKRRNVRGELESYGFDVSDDVMEKINNYIADIKDAPSEYFEAKISGVVELQEFSGAVIPKTTGKSVRAVLDKHGIPYVEYDENVKGDRVEKVRDFSESYDVAFARMPVNPKEVKATEAERAIMEQRARFYERAERSARARLSHAPESWILQRAQLEADMLMYKEQKLDEVRKQLYNYARKIKLNAETYNRVDTFLKNTKTVARMKKVMDLMDDIIEKRVNRKLVGMVEERIAKERKYLEGLTKQPKSVRSYEQNKRLEQYLDRITSTTAAKQAEAERMLTDYANDPNRDVPADIQKAFDLLARNNIREMTNDELAQVLADIKQIKNDPEGRLKHEVAKADFDHAVDMLAVQVVPTIKKGEKEPSVAMRQMKYFNDEEQNRLDRKSKLRNPKEFFWAQMRSENILEWMNGWSRGDFLKMTFDKIKDATEQESKLFRKDLKTFQRIHDGVEMAKGIVDPTVHIKVEISDAAGNSELFERDITLDQAMFIYAHSQNPNSYRHLVGKFEEGGKGIHPLVIEDVIDKLSQDHKDMVDEMIDYYDTVVYDRLNEAFRKQHGIDMPKENRYFPIMRLSTDRAENEVVMDMLMRNSSRGTGLEKGQTKTRVKSSAPFENMSYFETIIKSLRTSNHLSTFWVPVQEVSAVLNHPEIKNAMVERNPMAAKEVHAWLRRNSYGRISQPGGSVASLAEAMRLSYVPAVLAGNIMTMMKQGTSLAMGMDVLENRSKSMPVAIAKWMKNPRAMTREINGKSTFMADRRDSFQREFQEMAEKRFLQQILGTYGAKDITKEKLDAFKQFAMEGIKSIDSVTVNLLWHARYSEVLQKGGTEKEAIDRADELIRKTQPVGGVLNLPTSFTGNAFERMYTMFMNQPNQNLQRTFEMFSRWGEEKTSRNMSKVFWRAALPSAIFYTMSNAGQLPIDDPEGWLKELIRQMIGGVPIYGQLAMAGVDWGTGKIKEMRGGKYHPDPFVSDFTPSAFGILEKLGRLLQNPSLPKFTEFAGMVTGMPVVFTKRALEAWKRKDLRYLVHSKQAMKPKGIEGSVIETMANKYSKKEDVKRSRAWVMKQSPKKQEELWAKIRERRVEKNRERAARKK